MIAKHVPIKSIKKSDFAVLVTYLTDEQDKRQRVGHVAVTNCHSSRTDAAILEVLNTQAQNTRAASDKTYHLVVSFRAGERPDAATLAQIEARICDGLGYGAHQRISVVHHDTDNLHVHIAINKIHPSRYTIHDPYNDHKTLAALCEKLEADYGLERDNHEARTRGATSRADDMERHAGVESLLGWIKRECLAQLLAAQSWAEMHRLMGAHGLEIKARGNGVVIADASGTMVKASSVARELSKTALEARLGPFVPSPKHQGNDGTKPARCYRVHPIGTRADTVELYARYTAEQQGRGVARMAEWTNARERKRRLIEAAKRAGRLKRAAIKLMRGPGVSKKALYFLTSRTLKAEIEKINAQYLKERQAIYEKYQRQAWADWLRREAIRGGAEALAALRSRAGAHSLKGNTVAAVGGSRVIDRVDARQDSITKKGTIIYRAGASAVRDDGDKLTVSRAATPDALEAALRMAMTRYGSRITVNGTAEFKAHIVRIAASAQLAMTFADGALERRRHALLNDTTGKESSHDATARANRGGADRRRTGRLGSPAGARPEPTHVGTRRARGGKPDVGRVGARPPPESQNRLRNLSQLGVVHVPDGGAVLLPGHVSGDVEHQGPQPANGMRRGVSRAGVTTAAFEALDKYVSERDQTRQKIFDIPNHRAYNEHDAGLVYFAGLRHVDGTTLALLQHGEEILVLPIDVATERRLKRLAVGDPVTVSLKGTITTKARSR